MSGNDDVFQTAYLDVAKILDDVLGADEEGRASAGLAADVWLLAERYKVLRAAFVEGPFCTTPAAREGEVLAIEAQVLARMDQDDVPAS